MGTPRAPNKKGPLCAGGRETNPGAWLRIAETGGLSCCHIAVGLGEVLSFYLLWKVQRFISKIKIKRSRSDLFILYNSHISLQGTADT